MRVLATGIWVGVYVSGYVSWIRFGGVFRGMFWMLFSNLILVWVHVSGMFYEVSFGGMFCPTESTLSSYIWAPIRWCTPALVFRASSPQGLGFGVCGSGLRGYIGTYRDAKGYAGIFGVYGDI